MVLASLDHERFYQSTDNVTAKYITAHTMRHPTKPRKRKYCQFSHVGTLFLFLAQDSGPHSGPHRH